MEDQMPKVGAVEVRIIDEITTLHNEILGYYKRSLNSAIRIGELLVEQKKKLNHGEFTKWVDANLPFTDRTARNYMRLHANRDQLKTETVSDLTSGYKLLTEGKAGLYSELKQDISDSEFIAIMGRHAMGKRILEDYDKFGKPEYGGKTIKNLAKDIGYSLREVESWIQFAEKFPKIPSRKILDRFLDFESE